MRYAFADYVLDTSLFELRFKGTLRPLQPKPLDLLDYLVRHRNRIVLKSELLAHLWPGVHVTENAVAQAVACAREALSDTPTPAIVSVRGRGYRFTLPAVETPDIHDGSLPLFDPSEAVTLRVAARGAAPLATFRAVIGSYVEQLPEARLRSTPIAHLLAAADDEHALADLVTALFSPRDSEAEPSPVGPLTVVIENLERADLASLLLFALVAGRRREGLALVGTCAWEELAPDSAATRILSHAGALVTSTGAPFEPESRSVSSCVRATRRESGAAPRAGAVDESLVVASVARSAT